MKGKRTQVIPDFMNGFVKFLFSILALYLTLLAGFSTSAITSDEHTFILPDNILLNLAGTACFFVILICLDRLTKRMKWNENQFDRLSKGLLLLEGILGVIFVLATRRLPNADQRQIFESVEAIFEHDPSPFEMGGYLNLYPHQAGWVLFVYVLSCLFGRQNYLLFQLINVLCIIWIIRSMQVLVKSGPGEETEPGDRSKTAGMTMLIILFLPFLMYVNFIYGTIPGLAFALEGSVLQHSFRRTGKLSYAAGAILMMFFSITLKSNYMIFLIAAIIDLVRTGFGSRKLRYGICSGLMLLVLLFGNDVPRQMLEQISGQKLGSGIHPLAFVSMGLRENEVSYDGWWDGYNGSTYRASGFDSEVQKEMVLPDIHERLKDLANPRKAIKFFAGKNASQWNNPNFEAFCFTRFMKSSEDTPALRVVSRFLSVEWESRIQWYLNLLQFVVLSGVLLSLLLLPASDDHDFLFQMVIIGGFIFHTVWEAKGQYILPYFLLFFPMTVRGYTALLDGVKTKDRQAVLLTRKNIGFSTVFFVSVLVIASGRISFINNIFVPDDDSYAYSYYLNQNAFVTVPEGNYILQAGYGKTAFITVKEEVPVCKRGDEGKNVFVMFFSEADDTLMIMDGMSGLYLASPGEYPKTGQAVVLSQSGDDPDSKWQLVRGLAEKEYFICFRDGYAITRDEAQGTLMLSDFVFGDDQSWLLIPEE